jgi:DNA topoisomerase-3
MERKGKEIMPTSKGVQLIGLVPRSLIGGNDGKLEQTLASIGKGEASDGNLSNRCENMPHSLYRR